MTIMAWRIVLGVYMAFYVLAIAIERHGLANLSHRGPMTAAELFLTLPFAWGYVAYALQRGSIHWSALWRFTTCYLTREGARDDAVDVAQFNNCWKRKQCACYLRC